MCLESSEWGPGPFPPALTLPAQTLLELSSKPCTWLPGFILRGPSYLPDLSLAPGLPFYMFLLFPFGGSRWLEGRACCRVGSEFPDTLLGSSRTSPGSLEVGVPRAWGTLGVCGAQFSRAGVLRDDVCSP